MAGIFSSSKMPEPIITTPPPSSEDPAIKEAAEREAERIRKKKGVASTIMTGPLGVTEPANVLREKLGG